ncbi:MAG: UTP--glucose-1-phosphate uridylyltransferase [Lentisphaeria bacterium]|nr:UTP--glucose-1-phosphate uridylyltransferase [Lentisphaeria bacterium]
MSIRKAVIPAAGFGTRFLPFSKSVPKELIPLVDRPVIQYVLEEAVEAGIEDILIVLSSEKEAVIRHFNPVPELEKRLAERGKTDVLNEILALNRLGRIHYVYQQQLNGLGDAVLQADAFCGGEPFAVLLGDTVMDSFEERCVTRQLADVFNKYGSSVVALEEVAPEKVSSYGIAAGEFCEKDVLAISGMVEKPSPENAPSRLAFAARYIFTPQIFDELRRTPRGKDNELQLTDAMCRLLDGAGMYGCRIAGKRYDLGSKMGFLKGTVEFGLRRSEFKDAFADFLRETVKKLDEEKSV